MGGFEFARLRLPRMAHNLLHVASGNAVAVMINIATLSVLARMLGPALLGVLAMVEAYGRLVDQLLRLETWQAIVRYGVEPLEREERSRFMRLVKLGFILDLVGCIAAATVAFAAVPLAAHLLSWSPQTSSMAWIYCVVLLFSFSSTPTGILRVLDHFAEVAWVPAALAIARLAAIVGIWLFDGGIWAVFLATVVARIAENLVLAIAAWRLLSRRGFADAWRTPLKGSLAWFPGMVGFVLASNGNVLVRKGTQELDILVVGAFAGPAGAGVYQLARRIALAANKAGSMLQQVALPDMARLWVRGKLGKFKATIVRLEAITFGFGVISVFVLAIAGDRIILLIGGRSFEEAYTPLLVHMIAVLLLLSGSAMRAGIMASGHEVAMLGIVTCSAIAYCMALFVAVPHYGIIGGSLAHVAYSVVWLPASCLLFMRIVARPKAFPGDYPLAPDGDTSAVRHSDSLPRD